MRTYYIFKIKDKYNLKNEFNIYNTLYSIYAKKIDKNKSKRIILETLDFFNKKEFSDKLHSLYKNDEFYNRINNIHNYYDYFDEEETSLTVTDSFIKINTNKNLPSFLFDISYDESLFVCDFNNIDFFWIKQINAKLLV